ncbi:MAG: hypothetical protein EOM28_05565 [Clostridia bacterium]|nr:hypothetical protein [Anaerotignum sp.]NCC15804.1 hypothetical protein [Clostridia bacterium]
MSDYVWESVEIKQSARRAGEAFASVGQGRISLNADACDLIENIYECEYVEVNKAKKGTSTIIGLRFTKNKTSKSLHATRRKYKGELVDGVNINSKQLIKIFFGETKENITSRYPVEKVDGNMLAINIEKEL